MSQGPPTHIGGRGLIWGWSPSLRKHSNPSTPSPIQFPVDYSALPPLTLPSQSQPSLRIPSLWSPHALLCDVSGSPAPTPSPSAPTPHLVQYPHCSSLHPPPIAPTPSPSRVAPSRSRSRSHSRSHSHPRSYPSSSASLTNETEKSIRTDPLTPFSSADDIERRLRFLFDKESKRKEYHPQQLRRCMSNCSPFFSPSTLIQEKKKNGNNQS
eukprot:TRINITY_DN646_c0_g1_i2.p1 TRINITY_DN646_c0_g1~~TRINITY_DN646_c0_g1_i2.p1  ORF type:complete len:235 (+),score=42.79 TRINITY_DN646_c0_g1_i2:73-705(+)